MLYTQCKLGMEEQDKKGNQKNDAWIPHMCCRKKEVGKTCWMLKEVVEVIVDIQTNCVHTDHNSDNAPRRGKTVGDYYKMNNPRKRVLLHRMYNSMERENMDRKMPCWM